MKPALYRLLLSLLSVGILASILVSLKLSTHGFSGYDVSPMIDSGWRVLSGQVPGRDFIVTFPPSLYLATALSFHLFGITWRAIALGDCLLYLLLCLLGMRLASLLAAPLGRLPALLLSACFVAAQTILLVSINYLWHAALAQSFAIYAVLGTATLLLLPTRAPILTAELAGHLTLAFSCLLLSKPNTAFLTLLLCTWVLQRARTRIHLLGPILLAALLLSSADLSFAHTNLLAMLGSYTGLSGRLLPKPFVNGILFNLYARYGLANLLVYSICALTAIGVLRSAWLDHRQQRLSPLGLLAAGSVVIAVIGMGTNFDFKLTDTPLLLLGALLYALTCPFAPVALRRRTIIATLALTFVALYFGVTRFRMQIVGTWADDKCISKSTLNDPFFGHLVACTHVGDALAEVDKTLAQASPEEHVFFGPAMEFLYARNRIQSPLHLPNWWDPGSSFPKSREADVVRAWQDDHFDLLVFDHGDLAQIPSGILADLNTNYVLSSGNSAIDVYTRHP